MFSLQDDDVRSVISEEESFFADQLKLRYDETDFREAQPSARVRTEIQIARG